jgi:hypothetical protein
MLVSMVHPLFHSDHGALVDTLPNHGRRLFGSPTWTHPMDERTTHDSLIKATASLALLLENPKSGTTGGRSLVVTSASLQTRRREIY